MFGLNISVVAVMSAGLYCGHALDIRHHLLDVYFLVVVVWGRLAVALASPSMAVSETTGLGAFPF